MPFELVADVITKRRAYPALARWQARPYTPAWRQFGEHWPFTTPLRLEEYCHQHDVALNLHRPDTYPTGAWYPICLGFFDFDIDYIDLLPSWVVHDLKTQRIRLLFMYHEGDNPIKIKHRLDHLCDQKHLPRGSYAFVTANSSGHELENFAVFDDFELWYYQRNLAVPAVDVHQNPRSHDFLCLSRIHKSWRAIIMADLVGHGILERSFWSYCHRPEGTEDYTDSPIEMDQASRQRTNAFLDRAPYFCDDLADHERNDHSLLPDNLFSESFCNIVIESQFDVDGSGGVFITEKTFKPIKHGQLFFIAGAAGSLQRLRDLGYRVFDEVLDNSYDLVLDPTQRWLRLRDSILRAKKQGLHSLYQQAIPDLIHNQHLFTTAPAKRLNTLMQKLTNI